jgi:hypothetical protein
MILTGTASDPVELALRVPRPTSMSASGHPRLRLCRSRSSVSATVSACSAYLIVVLTLLWPSRFLIVARLTPAVDERLSLRVPQVSRRGHGLASPAKWGLALLLEPCRLRQSYAS